MTDSVKTAIDFTPAALPLKAAIAKEDAAYDKWRKAVAILYTQGLRYGMIGGEDADKNIRADLREFVVSMFPDAKRVLLSLHGRDVAELPDEDKAKRHLYQQRVGVYMSRIATYLRAFEDPQLRGAKKTAKTAPVEIQQTIGGYLMMIRDMAAKINLIGLSAIDASTIGDALQNVAALMSAAKTSMDKLAK